MDEESVQLVWVSKLCFLQHYDTVSWTTGSISSPQIQPVQLICKGSFLKQVEEENRLKTIKSTFMWKMEVKRCR